MLAKLIARRPQQVPGTWIGHLTPWIASKSSCLIRCLAPESGTGIRLPTGSRMLAKLIARRPQQVPGTGIGTGIEHLTPCIASKSWLGPSRHLARMEACVDCNAS